MPHPMRAKFGLSLSTRAVLFEWITLDDLLTAAQTAEASGDFDDIWVGDNLLSKPRAEALVTLSAIAARTQLWLAYGPPEAVIEKMHAYLDAGCTTPVLRFVAPNLHEQLQRCLAEVLPALRCIATTSRQPNPQGMTGEQA